MSKIIELCTYLPLTIFASLKLSAQSKPELLVPLGHSQFISCTDISSDGKLIATGGQDDLVIIWDSRSGNEIRSIKFENPIQKVKFFDNNRHLIVSSSEAMTANISFLSGGTSFSEWEVSTGKLVKTFPFTGNADFELFEDNMVIKGFSKLSENKTNEAPTYKEIFERNKGRLRYTIWNLSKENKVGETYWPMKDLKILATNKTIFYLTVLYNSSGGIANKFKIWGNDTALFSRTDLHLESWREINDGIAEVAVSHSKGIFAIVDTKGKISLYHLLDKQPFLQLNATPGNIESLEFSADDNYMFCQMNYGEPSKIYTWNLSNLKSLSPYVTNVLESSSPLIFSPDGSYIIKTVDRTAQIEDYAGDVLAVLRPHSYNVSKYEFSRGDDSVITRYNYISPKNYDAVKRYEIMMVESGFRTVASRWKGPMTRMQDDSIRSSIRDSLRKAVPKEIDFVWALTNGRVSQVNPEDLIESYDTITADKSYLLTCKFTHSGLQSLINAANLLNQSKVKDLLSPYVILKSPVTLLRNLKTKEEFQLISLDTTEWAIVNRNNYFMASQNGAKNLLYVSGINSYSFEQFDLKYNRPDIILQSIGKADKSLIDAYHQAYLKRIKKLGIDTSSFRNDFSVPECEIQNKENVADQTTQKLVLNIKSADKTYNLDRFNIWVNEVPVFTSKGISIRWHKKKNFDTTLSIVLSQGENRIETSVTNADGTESYRIPLFVKYTPAVPKKETIYFVGIGINRFADASYNLQYCAKDIRDLALKFKERYGSSLQIDTLFDENVTIDKVKAVKEKLLQSHEDDKVIVAYSGHGLLSKDYDYFLSTYNVNFSQPERNGLPYDELENLVDGIKARKKLMLIDACHSGELDKDEMKQYAAVKDKLDKAGVQRGVILVNKANSKLGLKNSFELMQQLFVNVGRGTGTTIISAASGTQYAIERGGNGVFTSSVIELLKPGQIVTVNELKKHVISQVSEITHGLQQPTTRNEIQNVDWTVW